MTQNDKNRKMSREEAGQKGGETTSREHGQEFYEEIGEKGGEKTSEKYSKKHFQDIGKKGGENSQGRR
ncbi:stress-induced protein, KGG, repeat-containing protein [Thalassobacillus sp. C254]|uniref:stress-induced protein, KGG, repeat-containing protein n=1 Tax=Thalassobacillus sp. C254 TaxID=1225341 RepID=UPI0006D0BB43|nr:stress-induced protein, KGG, repeat-containing protein [Thalassobacillus sp. C254]